MNLPGPRPRREHRSTVRQRLQGRRRSAIAELILATDSLVDHHGAPRAYSPFGYRHVYDAVLRLRAVAKEIQEAAPAGSTIEG